MSNVFLWIGRLAGASGFLLCAVSIVLRISGQYVFWGLELGTLFQAGTSGMIAGCFCLLLVLTIPSR